MNFDITRQSLFTTILCFLIFYVIFRGRELFFPVFADPGDMMMPLGRFLIAGLSARPVLSEVLNLFFSVLNGFYIARIISRNLIFLERSYMPALVYLLVAMGCCFFPTSTPVMTLLAFLLIFAMDNMVLSFRRPDNYKYFLHASVILGLLPLVYAPAVIYFLLLPVGFVIYKQNWRSIVISVVGYLLPIIFCSYVLWGMNERFLSIPTRIVSILTETVSSEHFIFRMRPWDYLLAGIVVSLVLFSVGSFLRRSENLRSRALAGFNFFIWSWFISLGLLVLPSQEPDMLPLFAVSTAAIIPYYFNRRSGLIPNLLYSLMVLAFLGYNLRSVLHI